ncbi:MAG TPA: FmdB family transcriptional regulator [Gammaproteobacteria bacterium]|nr:FmdB family transcriptional regulator [Gammaproteobacteria bacterium]
MPIYEYECQQCGKRHEALQKLSDEPLKDCPHCGEPGLRKLISAAGFRLKGGGWYETDFKSGQKKNLHQSGSGESSPSQSGQSSDTKPAASDSSTAGNKKKESKSSSSD